MSLVSASTVVITGGHGSLASHMATVFRERAPHWTVLTPSRSELDVTDAESIKDFFAAHPCDLLIANAGKIHDQPLLATAESTWDELLDVNLRGAAWCAKQASRAMIKKREGHILFLSSFSAISPPAGQVAYASAKAGLLGLTKALAQELGFANIRVNAIFPGFLENAMTEHVSPDRKEQVVRAHCLKRCNTESAVADFVFALHQLLPHTSGQVFSLDSRIAPWT